jgi:hypothetical protein
MRFFISTFVFPVAVSHFFASILSSAKRLPDHPVVSFQVMPHEAVPLLVVSITVNCVDPLITLRRTDVPLTPAETSSVSSVKKLVSVKGLSTRAQSVPLSRATLVSPRPPALISKILDASRRKTE